MEDKTDLAVLMSVAQEAAEEADTAQLVRALADLERTLADRVTPAPEKQREAKALIDLFSSSILKANSGALVYRRFVAMADEQAARSAALRTRLLDLARLVSDDIAASLADSEQLLLNAADLFQLSDRARQDIDYLYNSGACLDPEKHVAGPAEGKAYRDPDSILTLAWTLGVALSPEKT